MYPHIEPHKGLFFCAIGDGWQSRKVGKEDSIGLRGTTGQRSA